MHHKIIIMSFGIILTLFVFINARNNAHNDQHEPNQPGSKTELDIDMFIGSWKDSVPRYLYGSLEVHDILTKCYGDPLRPTKRGAVLTDINTVSFAFLAAHSSTTPTSLDGVQHLYYIDSGEGIVKSGNKTVDLRQGIGIIMPPDIEFTMTNSRDEQLTMYIVEEPITEGFVPKIFMVIKDEYDNPISTNLNRVNNMNYFLFGIRDGLSTLIAFNPVMFEPRSIYPPHVHQEGEEEIWVAINGEMLIQMGLKRRKLPAGSAYKVPPDGKTPHININNTETSKKLLWLSKVPVMRVPTGNKQQKLKGLI